jgi:hypothetical protein
MQNCQTGGDYQHVHETVIHLLALYPSTLLQACHVSVATSTESWNQIGFCLGISFARIADEARAPLTAELGLTVGAGAACRDAQP